MSQPMGPLPEKSYLGDDASYGYDACDMRAYAAQEVASAVNRCKTTCESLPVPAGYTAAEASVYEAATMDCAAAIMKGTP